MPDRIVERKHRKRQRTDWQYKYMTRTGGRIQAGWVHNPTLPPMKDVVRLFIQSDGGGHTTDIMMTPLEAMAISAGLMPTVQHRGWTGDLQKVGLHFEVGEDAMAMPGYEKCDDCGHYVEDGS